MDTIQKPIINHKNMISKLISTKPVDVLIGSFIWDLEYSSNLLLEFQELLEIGEIESYSPMLIKNHEIRYIPNDPDFSEQWHLQNTGQTNGGLTGEDINITGVWNSHILELVSLLA